MIVFTVRLQPCWMGPSFGRTLLQSNMICAALSKLSMIWSACTQKKPKKLGKHTHGLRFKWKLNGYSYFGMTSMVVTISEQTIVWQTKSKLKLSITVIYDCQCSDWYHGIEDDWKNQKNLQMNWTYCIYARSTVSLHNSLVCGMSWWWSLCVTVWSKRDLDSRLLSLDSYCLCPKSLQEHHTFLPRANKITTGEMNLRNRFG